MIKEKPEYQRAKMHLADPLNPDLFPRDQKEVRALHVVEEQRRYSEWKKRDAEKRRERAIEASVKRMAAEVFEKCGGQR
jgi:hypothetical protein